MAELWSGELQAVRVDDVPVVLVNVDGDVRAFEDRCCHLGLPISAGGRLENGNLVCSNHAWCFDARSGCGVNPSSVRLRPFAVRVEGDDLLVSIGAAGRHHE